VKVCSSLSYSSQNWISDCAAMFASAHCYHHNEVCHCLWLFPYRQQHFQKLRQVVKEVSVMNLGVGCSC
jgi:hypothetical protein